MTDVRMFDSREFTDAETASSEELRRKARELGYAMDSALVPSREASLAHTNLEQAVMWANAAICKYGLAGARQ